MQKTVSALILLMLVFVNIGCTVYTSSDRKKFETDTAALNTLHLLKTSCSKMSLSAKATASKLVDIQMPKNQNDPALFIWEHQIENKSVYESNNAKGIYCLYE